MTTASQAAHEPRGGRRGWLPAALRRTGIRVGALGVVAVVLANLELPWRPATLCLLRGITGIPCPVCGTTTAAVAAGRLDILGALAANPFVAAVTALIATAPLTGVLRRWDGLSNRSRVLVCVALLAAAETWQLYRAGLLPW